MTIDLTQVIVALIGLLSTVITVVLVPVLKTKFTDSQWTTLQNMITIGVSAAEQLSKVGEISKGDRKDYVINMIKDSGIVERLQKWGYMIDWATVSNMIEAAVYDLPGKITTHEVKKLAEQKVEAMAETTVAKKVTEAVESKLPAVVEQKVTETVDTKIQEVVDTKVQDAINHPVVHVFDGSSIPDTIGLVIDEAD